MKIVIATGGTGGHIHPAMEVASVLIKKGHKVVFLGSLGNAVEKLKAKGFPVENFQGRGLVKKDIKSLFVFFKANLDALIFSRRILKENRPDVVLGFGGYGSFPGVAAALLLKIPTIIHEQNAVPGRANKLLAVFVNKIAVSFDQARRFFNPSKTVLTGCPTHLIEKDLLKKELLSKYHLREDCFTILVTGGSQGSRAVNKIFADSAVILKNKLKFQFIHLTGDKDFADLKKKYADLNLPHVVVPFLAEMEEAYTLADCIIARSGALTITEIGLFCKPAILIPYPHAQGHQKENGLILAETGLAEVIDEKDLTPERLAEAVLELKGRDINLGVIQQKLKKIIFPDASFNIMREVEALA